MGQKVNPISLRLQYTNRHFDNSWYSDYFYKKLITKDILLQTYFDNFLKLIKLPSGRYSIQHLQKNSQIFHFICYSKYTREWRSKIFGLNKQKFSLKKNRFFFKNKISLNKRVKRESKLRSFFTTVNHQQIHEIQKKITSFQNVHLWSKFLKISRSQKIPNFLFPVTFLKITENQAISLLQQGFDLNALQNLQLGITQNSLTSPFLIKKIKRSISRKNQEFSSQTDVSKFFELTTETPNNLNFLRNLVIYKTLKSNYKLKNPFQIRQYGTTDSVQNFINLEKMSTSPLSKWNPLATKTKISQLKDLKKSLESFHSLNWKYKNYLESNLSRLYNLEITLVPFKVKNDWQDAGYLADEIIYFLEKRIPFRRLKSKFLKQLSKIPEIRGIRITCSGRVGGKSKKAQRAKTECIKYGETSLQVFSSKIDFSAKTAFTRFGSLGVNVWVCYH